MKTLKKQIVLRMACVVFALLSSITYAQNTNPETTTQRDGLTFEFVVGKDINNIEDGTIIETFNKSQVTLSFPGLKLGYLLNEKLALTLSIPGIMYVRIATGIL